MIIKEIRHSLIIDGVHGKSEVELKMYNGGT
jgi:hypothetical protein